MNAHPMWPYWGEAGLFALMGLWWMMRSPNWLCASQADCGLRVPPNDNQTEKRVEAAVERRAQAEGAPVPVGVWMGAIDLVLAAVCLTGRAPLALLYALMCFGMAICVAAAFLSLRNSQRKRVAVLSARKHDAVIPTYWFIVACLCVLAVLSYVMNPEFTKYRDVAIIISISSLITTAIAWRLTGLPALLSGVDIAAEQVVDDRLRFFRSRAAMLMVFAQTVGFCQGITGVSGGQNLVALLVTLAAMLAFWVWAIRRQHVTVQLA